MQGLLSQWEHPNPAYLAPQSRNSSKTDLAAPTPTIKEMILPL